MAETVVNLYEAKTRLSLLVERAAAGETIVIAKAGRPMARLVPVQKARRIRLGSLHGRIHVPEDFDRLASDEIEAMFHGR
ncbi:MAG: type II toxin-antitoxin system prevent-host-death family antitoxin [Burkholderiaceae bacterium]|nr:type II toxin-antitoxin system prevent-host-death family antitoxin [Burkholderiaceae bacterium]